MAERGVVVTYETVRDWSQKFGGTYAKRLRARAGRASVKEETNMSELRYPNESREYRDARESLLKDEQELVEK
jgi:hypothetical protein